MLGLAITLAFVLLLVIAGVAAYTATIYNSLVQVKNNVDQAWSNIDVLLKQRTDELGKLIDAVKGYLGYERDLLTRLTTLRSQVARGGPDENRLAAEREIGAAMGRVFALAENYPELKIERQLPRVAETHQRAGGADRPPPRVLQRRGQHQQRAHRAGAGSSPGRRRRPPASPLVRSDGRRAGRRRCRRSAEGHHRVRPRSIAKGRVVTKYSKATLRAAESTAVAGARDRPAVSCARS